MIVLSTIAIVAILYTIWILFKRESGAYQFWFIGGLLYKVTAGIALGLIYAYYYQTGDTLLYFEDASKLTALWYDSPTDFLTAIFKEPPADLLSRLYDGAPRALFFIKGVSIVNLFAFNNYWIAASYLSILSFMACWYLVRQVRTVLPAFSAEALVAFILLPSFVFWSSGIIKESVAALSMVFLAGVFLNIYHQRKLRWFEWTLALACTAAFWQLKYYWAGLFFMFGGSALLAQLGSAPFRPRRTIRWALWSVAILILGYVTTHVQPNLNLDRVLDVVAENNEAFVSISAPDDVIQFHDLEPTFESFAKNAPLAAWSGLFRPWVGEANSLFKIVASVENTFMLLISLWACFRLFRPDRQVTFIGMIAFGYCLSLSVFLALSTPNFGTLSRYRIGFLPFFVFLMLVQGGIIPMISRKRWGRTNA